MNTQVSIGVLCGLAVGYSLAWLVAWVSRRPVFRDALHPYRCPMLVAVDGWVLPQPDHVAFLGPNRVGVQCTLAIGHEGTQHVVMIDELVSAGWALKPF